MAASKCKPAVPSCSLLRGETNSENHTLHFNLVPKTRSQRETSGVKPPPFASAQTPQRETSASHVVGHHVRPSAAAKHLQRGFPGRGALAGADGGTQADEVGAWRGEA